MTAGKSTRVLLVRPRPPADSIGLHHFMICDPIELTQVAAALPPQFDVRIFDGILEGGDRPLRRAMSDFQPDVVAATCYINGVDEVGKIFDAARTVAPRALRVVGGVHATLNSEDFVKIGPDVLVAGEGTFTFRDLCLAWRDGGRSGLAGVPGTALFNGAGFDFAAPRPWPSPDDLPIARRELVRRHWPDYYYIYHRPCFMLKTAFGCPYTCGFCYCWKVTGGAYQYASPERVVDELAGMWARDAYIVDDDFLLHPERLERFCELMEQRRVKKGFFCYGRADFVSNYPDLIKRLSRVGLKAVVVGVESFSRRELSYYHKQSHEEHNARCFDTLRRADVDVYASFILSPDWGLEDFREMQQYIYQHRLYYVILQPLMPLPGTDIWDEWKDHVIIDRDHHSLWDISHLCLPSRLPMEVYYREMIKLYLRTTLDLRRLPGLKLRTLPPLWSPQIPRNVWGAAKILWQLAHAHERYRPGEVARYEAGLSRPIARAPAGASAC
jgi:radical SAM superfamily enzyme YgiQ (UPF0313 family)